MDSVGALILFSILGAAICAKARVAGGAIVFSLIGLVLFVSTPAGSGLPRAVSRFFSTVDGAATPALTRTTVPAPPGWGRRGDRGVRAVPGRRGRGRGGAARRRV